MKKRPKVQVLVASMNQTDHSLLEKMNISTSAIVGNQCNYDSVERFEWNGNECLYLNFNERGVGLNRNNSLMRATGDICLFADDDMVFVDDYETIVINEFEKLPDADLIIFNILEVPPVRSVTRSTVRINRFNYLKYGTARFAIKTESIKSNGIYFNQCFGGGTQHRHGEDNLFLTDCLKKGLKIYAVSSYLAELVNDREPTWNREFDEKYFLDQGALYRAISKRGWKLLCLQDAVRHSKKRYKQKWNEVYRLMVGRG